MRICLVSIVGYPHGIGGMQDHTCDLARGLVDAGHEVEVVTAAHPEGIADAVRDGVRWRFVEAPSRHMDARWRRASADAVLSAHRERPFDVVHGQGSSGLELFRRGAHHEVPIVTMFHGNFVSLARACGRRAAERRTPRAVAREAKLLLTLARDHFPHGNWYRFRAGEAIVPSRQQLRDTCRSHVLDPAHVHVVPNGVDTSRFRPLPRAEQGGAAVVFACVGRLNHEKGFHHAVRALAALVAGGIDARLVVVGDGEERDRLAGLAAELGVAERVELAGRQSPEGVAARLGSADAFLFPTEREEAAPLVLPQAMACGLPVVASSIGGITEVIDLPGRNGLLVEPGATEALAAAMRELAVDQALRERLGRDARDRVLAEYTVERMTERTLAVYDVARSRFDGKSARPAHKAPAHAAISQKASGH